MSKYIYQVTFDPRIQIELNELISSIHKTLAELSAKRVEVRQQEKLSRLKWIPDQEKAIDVKVPEFEANMPPEFAEDLPTKNEKMFVSVQKDGLGVMITDASLPKGKCEEIVTKFAQKVYNRATGKNIPKESILIRPIGHFENTICEFCLETIDGYPYRCGVCGRCFCYDHRTPESHECLVKRKEESKTVLSPPSRASKKAGKSRVIVRQIPCG